MSQLETFDYKPQLEKLRGQELPDSVRNGQRFTSMTAAQSSFPLAPSLFKFAQHGQSGAWISELMPYTAKVADACVVVPTVNPENITPHSEAFQAVVWHLLVSHPKLKANQTKWESAVGTTSSAR